MAKNSMKASGGPQAASNKRPTIAPMNKGTTGLPSGSPSMPSNKEYAARAGNKGSGNKHLEGPQTRTGLGYGS